MDAHVSMCEKRDGEIWKKKIFYESCWPIKSEITEQ